MRNKKLEKKRNVFIIKYYKLRSKQDASLTKRDVASELNMFYCFYSKSNIYKILQGQ